MEGPGLLRRKTATAVPMRVVRHSGWSTSTPALRQPRASERTWKRREGISVWGSLDHQKCPTMRRNGGVDSLPSLCGMASPRATTGESRKGIKSHMRSASRSGGGSASSLPSLGEREYSEVSDGGVGRGRNGPRAEAGVVRPIRLACRVGGRGAPQRVGAIAGVTVEEGMPRGVDGPSITW